MECSGMPADLRPTGSTTPIGRDHEIRRLIELLDAMAPGRVSVLVIEGPPGARRTRLLDEPTTAARRTGATAAPERGATVASESQRRGGWTRARLENQFAELSPRARHLLQAATTLCSPFPLVKLTRLLQVSPVLLLPAVDEVLASGLLTGANEMLMFSHELVRSVVESSIPRSVVAALRAEHARLSTRPAQRGGRAGGPAARHTVTTSAVPARRVADWSLLTVREREIADLVGRALTNRQIANRVGRSPHTVNYHLRQIFQKLDITSRVELASLTRQREEATAAVLPAAGSSSS